MALDAIIEESLEQLVEAAGDPTAAVYERLFRLHPDMRPLFQRDVDGAVKGEMLAKLIECVLDLAGPNAYAANFIACEIVNHEGVGIPREVFPAFFDVAVDTFRELLGPRWTPAYDEAWGRIIARVRDITATVAA